MAEETVTITVEASGGLDRRDLRKHDGEPDLVRSMGVE